MRIKPKKLLPDFVFDKIRELPERTLKRFRKRKKMIDYHLRYKKKKCTVEEMYLECLENNGLEDKDEENIEK